MKRIGIGSENELGTVYEEIFITDYDCRIGNLYNVLGEYESLNELNYLASKIEELSENEKEHFEAAMEISDYAGSVKDLINLTENLNRYEVYPGIEDYDDLGRMYIDEYGILEVPDPLKNYFDYAAYGRDVAMDEGGSFTSYGYIRDNYDTFREFYHGSREDIPEEYLITGNIEELAIPVTTSIQEKKENYLRAAELSREQNYNMIDGQLNNIAPERTREKPSSVLARLKENEAMIQKNAAEKTPDIAKIKRLIEPERS